jgi:hypothetical protein
VKSAALAEEAANVQTAARKKMAGAAFIVSKLQITRH